MGTSFRLIAYGPEGYSEHELSSLSDLATARGDYPCAWLDVAGPDAEKIGELLVEYHGVHRLAVADLSNARQRPKVEELGDHLFVTTRMVEQLADDDFHIEPFYIWLFDDLLITVQATEIDCLDRIRLRSARACTRCAISLWTTCSTNSSMEWCRGISRSWKRWAIG